MADFSSYTHKWRATTSEHRDEANKVSKRNRQPVSCVPCRTRKLKCDRNHPCDSCTKRNDEDSCVYGKAPSAVVNGKENSRPTGKKAQDRLRHLEELVKQMIQPTYNVGHANLLTPPSVDGQSENSPKEGTLNSNGVDYTGQTHWSAVLEFIHELKQDLDSEGLATSAPVDFSVPDSLFGAARPASLQSVLEAYLPPRVQVDRRLSQYFNAKYMIIPFIHKSQFQRQYESFWTDPLNTSPLWVSILFSICCLAASLTSAAQTEVITPPGAVSARDNFELASSQCLILGNYSKPQPFVVEALALFLQCKYASTLDPSREVAMIFSIQTRLAYLMAYHRDGSNFPDQFTPFEAEMRRRAWAMLKQFNLMVSFQLGIPNTIPLDTWDTRTPRNLLDTDFDEDISELPPPRPPTEATQILYFTVKAGLMDVFAKVCQHTISFFAEPPTRAEVMSIDSEIREKAKDVPPVLQHRRISESITDPVHIIMVRLNIAFLWKKSLCVLHRKYMTQKEHADSYHACVDSAASMCDILLDMYPEFQPGGLFENDRWMLTSFTITDFLLACMVLCLAMSVSRKKSLESGETHSTWLQSDETKKIIDLLDRSQIVCAEFGVRSKESKRVALAIKAVLEKLNTSQQWPAGDGDGNQHQFHLRADTVTKQFPRFQRDSEKREFSLTPLSLSDKVTSVTPATGMFPPEAFTMDEPPATYLNETRMNSSDDARLFGQNGSVGHEPVKTGLPTPWSTEWPSDPGLGSFPSIMAGMNGPDQIDWAQIDQFTGPYGTDFDIDSNSTNWFPAYNDSQPLNAMDETSFGADWDSSPHRFLGGNSRDPMTGASGPGS